MKEIITCKCGDNATGTFDISTGVLTIRGTGSISNYCIYNAKTLVIGDGITSIGDGVFSYHGLTTVYLSDSVTSIGNCAFAFCTNLTSVIIPADSVTSIGDYAFWNCVNLTSINIPYSVISIGKCAFDNCESLKSINIPESVISIGSYAFFRCKSLISIIIPESVTSIGEHAFSDSGLQTIYGKSVSYAEEYANEYYIDFVALDNNINFYVFNEDYSFFINSYALIYLYRNIYRYYSFFLDCIIQEVDDFGSAVRSPLKYSVDNIDKNLVKIARISFLLDIGSKNFI